MKKDYLAEISLHQRMEGEYRYEMTLVIDKSDVYFSKFEKAKPYVAFHWQDSYEIIYVLRGEQTILLEDRAVILKSGDCAIINPSILHAAQSTEDNQFILVMLPLAFVRKYMPGDQLLRFDLHVHSNDPRTITNQMEFKRVLDDMYALSTVKPYGYELRLNSLVFELLFQLLQNFSTNLPGTAKKISAKQREQLANIINHVYENYGRNISIEEGAGLLHLQPQYFCRFFKKHMGKTFLEFVNEVRLYHVYLDMVKTDLPVNQIAEKNGFSNYDTFLKTFRTRLGCTPSEFRAMPSAKATELFQGSVSGN